MTTTPRSTGEDSLSESWVDLSVSPGRLTPVSVHAIGFVNGTGSSQFVGPYAALSLVSEEYIRLLKEAQRESNHSSARVSLASSRRDSRSESPKSPPNSPNNELSNGEDELKGIFINKESEGAKEWVLNYLTARCDSQAKNTTLSEKKSNLSLGNAKFSCKALLSKEVMYTLIVSNFISLLLGAGIGLWLSKRSSIPQYSLN